MFEHEYNFILTCRNHDPDTLPRRCGEEWSRKPLACYSEFKLRPDKARAIERAAAEDLQVLEAWSSTFKETATTRNVRPSDLYSFDESPIHLGQADTTFTIALATDISVQKWEERETRVVQSWRVHLRRRSLH